MEDKDKCLLVLSDGKLNLCLIEFKLGMNLYNFDVKDKLRYVKVCRRIEEVKFDKVIMFSILSENFRIIGKFSICVILIFMFFFKIFECKIYVFEKNVKLEGRYIVLRIEKEFWDYFVVMDRVVL